LRAQIALQALLAASLLGSTISAVAQTGEVGYPTPGRVAKRAKRNACPTRKSSPSQTLLRRPQLREPRGRWLHNQERNEETGVRSRGVGVRRRRTARGGECRDRSRLCRSASVRDVFDFHAGRRGSLRMGLAFPFSSPIYAACPELYSNPASRRVQPKSRPAPTGFMKSNMTAIA
jgi:hypothetical protein